jgi:hypothetical protein
MSNARGATEQGKEPTMSNNNLLTEGDVFTLIGHAELLRGRGETDMPAWFLRLAHQIALGIDESLALRVEALATKHDQACAEATDDVEVLRQAAMLVDAPSWVQHAEVSGVKRPRRWFADQLRAIAARAGEAS